MNRSSVDNFMQLLSIKQEVSHQEVDHELPQRVLMFVFKAIPASMNDEDCDF